MAKTTTESAWGFEPVHDLIRSLSSADVLETAASRPPNDDAPPSKPDRLQVKPPEVKRSVADFVALSPMVSDSLGDFSKIWDFLGASVETPRVVVSTIVEREEYTSDGAIYRPPSSKGVKWRDEATFGAAELTDTAPEDLSEAPASSAMTNKQRKKLRQKEAKQKSKAATDLESEGELVSPRKKAPAAKAGVHNAASDGAMPAITTTKPALVSIPKIPKKELQTGEVSQSDIDAAREAVATSLRKQPHNTPLRNGNHNHEGGATSPTKQAGKKQPHETPKVKANAAKPLQTKSEPRPFGNKRYFESSGETFTPTDDVILNPAPNLQHQPFTVFSATPYQSHFPAYTYMPQMQTALFPSIIPPPHMSYHASQTSLPNIPLMPHPDTVQQAPLTLRSRDDRYWSLRLKLLNDFPDDRSWLVKLVQHADHTSNPSGIHVFVDFSNIYIGFLHRLEEILSRTTKTFSSPDRPPKTLDFESLVLLLERGRPVAKRVLAGSAPLLPAFDLAKSIGYELNILEKVYKSRELTQRQKFFKRLEEQQQQQSQYSANSTPSTHPPKPQHHGRKSAPSSGQSSEAEASPPATPDLSAAEFAPEKWVEQGVDEILHLKMLESVVDAAEPATIVLATGDAAEAEYSAGFMKMVERALVKGWRVELVAFGRSISKAYRAKGFARRWKGRFRLVELDGYLDELVDT